MGRPLTTILPAPGRMRTRATACFRRPVVWTRGLGTRSVLLASAGQVESLGRLGGVRVLGPGIDLELAQHLTAEGALGQHAAHGLAHGLFGLARRDVGV